MGKEGPPHRGFMTLDSESRKETGKLTPLLTPKTSIRIKRKRGRPKNSWRRDTEEEMRSISTSWQDLRKKAQRRVQWKNIIVQYYPHPPMLPCSYAERRVVPIFISVALGRHTVVQGTTAGG
ncbi:hypothetical protein Bbelb_084880 [Branchiostoma belcheri]|nr:hypothetical protein Bbelb_084880 [Branchiostoma belcheri]